MNITIIGCGYVGLANAALLAQHNAVYAVDIIQAKVDMLNARVSPILDSDIQEYLATRNLSLTATTDACAACRNADYIIISTPTDYDENRNIFDTSSVETAIHQALSVNQTATIVIKSTVPVGYTKKLRERLNYPNIIFSPEFLREGRALHDNLYPSRIVVGAPDQTSRDAAQTFADLMKHSALKENIPVLITDSTEAEAIKLFSNAYLALRVSFFNELDSYAERYNLNAKEIIDGVCLDPRISGGYNNPSFGYGGYCLPKDTKQLLANYDDVPNNIIRAIVEANRTRKDYIAERVMARNPKIVGIYRLTMKTDSDNFRQSSILGIMRRLKEHDVDLLVYEPTCGDEYFYGVPVCRSLEDFKSRCDLIVANRWHEDLSDVSGKVYTRDLFEVD